MASPAEAQSFYTEGMRELDKLAEGEGFAKRALLANMVLGQSLVLVGNPGGAKTTLAGNAYKLVDGIETEHLAVIPPSAELTPTQLVGGAMEVVRKEEGEESKAARSEVTGIIKPTTKVIWANELNRMNPHGVNAAFEAYVDHVVDTTAGRVELNDFEFGVSTMNPNGGRYATFDVDPALASRHTFGIELGRKDSRERQQIVNAIRKGFRPDPDKVEPVIDLATLHEIRESVKGVAIPGGDFGDWFDQSVLGTVDRLADFQVHEADGRITTQIADISKGLATLDGLDRIEDRHLQSAITYALGSRLGALTVALTTHNPAILASEIMLDAQ